LALFIGLIICCSSGSGDGTKALMNEYNPTVPTVVASPNKYGGGGGQVVTVGSNLAGNV
jgi:hypothetical protein